MEIIAKELHLDEGHPDVYKLFIAVYQNFVEVSDNLLYTCSIFVFLMGVGIFTYRF